MSEVSKERLASAFEWKVNAMILPQFSVLLLSSSRGGEPVPEVGSVWLLKTNQLNVRIERAAAAEHARHPALMHFVDLPHQTQCHPHHSYSAMASVLEAEPLPPKGRITVRNPPFTYLHLVLLSSSNPLPISNSPPIDILTARAHLTSALSQFLGITGTAIPIDFLKHEGRDVWIRVPREDAAAVVGALSQWVGKDGGVSWRVKGKGQWLGLVAAEDGHELFQP